VVSVRPSISLSIVVAVLGFLLVTATVTARERRLAEAPRRAELVSLIGARQDLVDSLDGAVQELRADVATEQTRAAANSTSRREAARREAQLAAQAGTVALSGPGVVVTVDHSDRKPPSPQEAGAYRIHDADVQLIVNALLAAGAEAVAVNESRVVATTPIRSAGDTLLVNFRPQSPPYAVAAIGADRAAFDQSLIARRFRRWTRLFGLSFRVAERDEIVVPPHTGRVAITAAVPDGTGT
jgi:uncharacterized protein YlxW (UPF0749 family)